MTAGGVPAIDFGGPNELRANQPSSFASAVWRAEPDSFADAGRQSVPYSED